MDIRLAYACPSGLAIYIGGSGLNGATPHYQLGRRTLTHGEAIRLSQRKNRRGRRVPPREETTIGQRISAAHRDCAAALAPRNVHAHGRHGARAAGVRTEADALLAELKLLRELATDVARWRETGGDPRDLAYILDTMDKLKVSDE